MLLKSALASRAHSSIQFVDSKQRLRGIVNAHRWPVAVTVLNEMLLAKKKVNTALFGEAALAPVAKEMA